MPGIIRTRDRASLPTVDAVGGARPPEALETASADLLAVLPESVLGVTAEHVGRYVAPADSELGRGGIGRVYVAADRHLGREVAVKELLLDRVDAAAPVELSTLVRFLREARITGKLEHPNIAPVHELGRRADGSLYYTMRVVRGRTLALALADTETLADRLKLLDHFIGLCQAIAYAHSRAVVHRDIKPDNVMIGEFGETVVLDWGMAKVRTAATASGGDDGMAVDRLEHFGLNVTMEGSLCGTPTHMSPEQARGALDEVDERSDVWALGVVLYTILTGRTPFEANTLPELIRRIGAGAHRSPRAVNAEIPAELSAIVERALRRDPGARYPSARELLRDVEAYRSGARVGAYEYTTVDLLGRFIERHRTAVIASAIGLCVTLLLTIASYVRLAAARDRAREAERRATQNERAARDSERRAKESLSLVLVEKAEQAILEGDRTDAELLAAEALKLGERADARGLSIAADSGFRPEPVFTVPKAAGCTRYAMAYPPALLACARTDGISVYGLRDGALRLHAPTSGASTALELSGDGKTLLRVQGGELALLEVESGGRTSLERHVGPISIAALSGDGNLMAWAMQNVVVVSEVRSGGEWRLRFGQGASALAFSPDAQTLVVGGELGLTTLWDFRSDRSRQLVGHTGTVRALAFARQGRYLATGAADRSIRFWDTREGVSVAPPLVHSDAITSIGFTADARLIAFGSKDKTFHVVELKDGERRAEVRFHDDSVDWIALAADGSEVASVSRDLGVERWSLASLRTPSALVGHGNVLSFAFVPGTNELVSAGLGSEGVGVWNVENGVCRTRLPAGIDRVRALAVSPDGTRLAFAGSEGRTLLWDLPAGVPLRVFDGSRDEVRAVAFSRDRRWLAFAGLDRVIRVVDTETFSPLVELDDEAPVQGLAFSNADGVLVSGDRDGMLSLWDVGQKRRLLRFKAHDDWALAVAISRDGTRIASAGADRHVRIWNAASGALVADLAGHEGRVFAVDFSSDGQLLASGAEDKTVRVWNVRDARELAVLTGHTAAVRAVHFAADRSVLATAGDDGVTRLWRLATLFEPGATLGERLRSRYDVGLSGTHVVRLPGP